MHSGSSSDLVDTHCHLNFEVFDDDRDLILERARNNRIIRILIPGIDIETSASAIRLASKYNEIYAAVGIHPNNGFVWSNNSNNELRKLANSFKVVAIGEIGLDYYREIVPRELQKKIFREQLELAADLNLPVIIHNRDASKDLLDILRDWQFKLSKSGIELGRNPGVLHSFSGDEKFAGEAIALNFRIGITGPVTFKKSQGLQSLVNSIPTDNLIVETDSPFLTPHPFRGKRNEPANVRIVAEKISEIKGIPFDQVATITTMQANILFKWSNNH